MPTIRWGKNVVTQAGKPKPRQMRSYGTRGARESTNGQPAGPQPASPDMPAQPTPVALSMSRGQPLDWHQLCQCDKPLVIDDGVRDDYSHRYHADIRCFRCGKRVDNNMLDNNTVDNNMLDNNTVGQQHN